MLLLNHNIIPAPIVAISFSLMPCQTMLILLSLLYGMHEIMGEAGAYLYNE